MHKILSLICFFFLLSCNNENETNKLIVKGNIKELKKGTIYLKKANDTLLITVDSLRINGNSNFRLESKIDEPEIFFLELDKNDNDKSQISFFANKGVTEINTSLKNFVFDAEIKGSEQQKILQNYRNMLNKFNSKSLDLIKENLEAMVSKDTLLIIKTAKQQQRLEKRKYLYTVNYAVTNNDSEVAPYLAITELYNSNIKLLDTINNSITPRIKASVYGKKLKAFLDKVKAEK